MSSRSKLSSLQANELQLMCKIYKTGGNGLVPALKAKLIDALLKVNATVPDIIYENRERKCDDDRTIAELARSMKESSIHFNLWDNKCDMIDKINAVKSTAMVAREKAIAKQKKKNETYRPWKPLRAPKTLSLMLRNNLFLTIPSKELVYYDIFRGHRAKRALKMAIHLHNTTDFDYYRFITLTNRAIEEEGEQFARFHIEGAPYESYDYSDSDEDHNIYSGHDDGYSSYHGCF